MTARRPMRPGGRVLFIVATMLVGSAAIRFGAGPGAAIARDLTALTAQPGEQTQAQDRDLAPELVALLAELKEREARVENAEVDIAARFEVLARVEAEIQRDLERLTAAEEALRATISLADTAAANDIARLTSVYENMRPEEAAALFQKMEPSFAAGFLGEMRPDAAAGILAGLDADLAYSISVVLAGRNADVPTDGPAGNPSDGAAGQE